ncbi:MAG: hypothetical protein ACPGRX_06270, partial [Bdellovibrionales bacterium]
MDNKAPDPALKKLYTLYILYGLSLVFSVIPHAGAAALCLVFFLAVLGAAYVMRKREEADSLTGNHATFIIRSMWIAALFSVFTMIAATIYMMPRIDYTGFDSCAQNMAGHDPAALEAMGYDGIYALIEPCLEGFISGNYTVFFASMLIGGAPPLMYLVFR